MLARCGGKGTLAHCWMECKSVQLWVNAIMEVLQKAKNRTTIGPDDTTSRNTSEGM
jgi:hypothetical protein